MRVSVSEEEGAGEMALSNILNLDYKQASMMYNYVYLVSYFICQYVCLFLSLLKKAGAELIADAQMKFFLSQQPILTILMSFSAPK